MREGGRRDARSAAPFPAAMNRDEIIFNQPHWSSRHKRQNTNRKRKHNSDDIENQYEPEDESVQISDDSKENKVYTPIDIKGKAPRPLIYPPSRVIADAAYVNTWIDDENAEKENTVPNKNRFNHLAEKRKRMATLRRGDFYEKEGAPSKKGRRSFAIEAEQEYVESEDKSESGNPLYSEFLAMLNESSSEEKWFHEGSPELETDDFNEEENPFSSEDHSILKDIISSIECYLDDSNSFKKYCFSQSDLVNLKTIESSSNGLEMVESSCETATSLWNNISVMLEDSSSMDEILNESQMEVGSSGNHGEQINFLPPFEEETSSIDEESTSIQEESPDEEEAPPMAEKPSVVIEANHLIQEESFEEEEPSIVEEINSFIEKSTSIQEESPDEEEASPIAEDPGVVIEANPTIQEESLSETEFHIFTEDRESVNGETISPIIESSTASSDSFLREEDPFPDGDESSMFAGDFLEELLEEEPEQEDLESNSLPMGKDQHQMVKVPVVLAHLIVDVDVMETFEVLGGISAITKVDWTLHSIKQSVVLPSSTVFIKGILTADIVYVKDDLDQKVHTIKFPVQWNESVKVKWLTEPDVSYTCQNEYTFGHEGDTHYEHRQKFSNPVEDQLHSIHIISHPKVIAQKEVSIQGNVQICIDLLQQKYVYSHFS
ncbi:hypothetical protein [Halobacillus litoralis]|uniref:hypothetical protein n=1 Tax=Halobacillus litoralis TaxID=45668 RepID=UPI0024915509|nr:hypothetical protein [Halobacillus litoralis]